MKKLIILSIVLLVSCKEKQEVSQKERLNFITDSVIKSLNDGCASGRYECVPSFTVGTSYTLSFKGCLTETVTCKSCGNSTVQTK